MSYDENFYIRRKALSRASAELVLAPLIETLKPASMLDVGCGTGSWLAVASELGVASVQGIDGSTVPREQLEIPESSFSAQDLNQALQHRGRVDLAICIEVAEHLKPERGESLVAELVERADAVLFGAAIPEQIGTHHINCRWQSYWATLFARHGYRCLNFVQERFWHERRINVVYRQNTGLYLKRARYTGAQWDLLLLDLGNENAVIDLVHPELYLLYLSHLKQLLVQN